jgi:hypothetical protein
MNGQDTKKGENKMNGQDKINGQNWMNGQDKKERLGNN